MQCEVRTMSGGNTRSRPARTSDTLPKPGRVTEVCKEWVVHEDGALAYRLQKEEVEHHLTGNKCRNAIVREDIPKAREEQQREEEEAIANYHMMVMQQEERDAAVARQLAQRIQWEEEERRRLLELQDKQMARQIQERELKRHSPSPPPPPEGDVNSVGLPDVSDLPVAQFRNLTVREDWPPPPPLSPPPPELVDEDEEQRRIQELRDEELARLLQQQEGGEALSQVDRDRLVAIEAQDKELARLLQEKERAKARRARERAKQKALLKKQQEAAAAHEGQGVEGGSLSPTPELSPPHHRHHHRYSDPEAIEVLSAPLPNIAMAIDPTYCPHSTGTSSSSTHTSPSHDFEEFDEGPIPPYMPIQGQRRTSSLEKKKKKQPKDGCKQQ